MWSWIINHSPAGHCKHSHLLNSNCTCRIPAKHYPKWIAPENEPSINHTWRVSPEGSAWHSGSFISSHAKMVGSLQYCTWVKVFTRVKTACKKLNSTKCMPSLQPGSGIHATHTYITQWNAVNPNAFTYVVFFIAIHGFWFLFRTNANALKLKCLFCSPKKF